MIWYRPKGGDAMWLAGLAERMGPTSGLMTLVTSGRTAWGVGSTQPQHSFYVQRAFSREAYFCRHVDWCSYDGLIVW